MALVLGVYVEQDNRIFLDELLVTIDDVISKSQAKITIHGEFIEEQKVLNDKSYTQVTNKVKMMLGLFNSHDKGFCKVLVEAPRNISVLRGKLKDRS